MLDRLSLLSVGICMVLASLVLIGDGYTNPVQSTNWSRLCLAWLAIVLITLQPVCFIVATISETITGPKES